jgi:hypothetical protein
MIEIILEKSILDVFGIVGFKQSKLLDRIFLVEKNLFVLSKELVDYIENNATEPQKHKWFDLYTMLNDNKQIAYAKNNTLNTDMIFTELPKKYDFVIVLTNTTENDKSCAISNTNTLNNIFLNLLQNNAHTAFSHVAIQQNTEITSIFNKFFNCSKSNAYRMIIISRYLNTECEIIRLIKHYFPKKSLWTTHKKVPCITNNGSALRTKLGNSLELHTGSSSQIHERELIIGNMVIDFNDDFYKITTDNPTWNCNIMIDQEQANSLRAKQSILTRIYPT